MTRKEAINKLQYIRLHYPSKDIENIEADNALYMAIEALQQQKEGEWIVKEDNTSFVKQIPRRWVECSVCGWSFSYDRIYDEYCSKCGAKMKEGE